MNRNLNRRIHPIAEANGLSPKFHRNEFFERICHGVEIDEKGNKIIQTKLFND